MTVNWSEVQSRRLKELNAGVSQLDARFDSTWERDRAYQKLENELVKRERQRLRAYREVHLRPGLCRLESRLIKVLVQHGFAQVETPIIMAKGLLHKMSIGPDHPLVSQIFWLDHHKCLRPMLAPHLYFVLKDLLRLWDKPVRIFEVGPCFRKESQGAQHSSEFTMLNLVEMGLPEAARQARIAELAALVTQAAGVHDYHLVLQTSEVYGETIDVVDAKKGLEIGSGAMGPHPLDRAWQITDPWVGIGFGVERLLMAAENSSNLSRIGRSLSYLDGVRLNI